ncbi:hypothetical protein DPMN_019532 [Dreissena polymorpha]|uniref:Uncharacterized protein n=1 Tax=Dreissena polymorpha TaxID=45954 RepID=A0A9D4NF75_DREPO|nr:hypothetical protein DPMN_019532 [Dreissena polymorpha]
MTILTPSLKKFSTKTSCVRVASLQTSSPVLATSTLYSGALSLFLLVQDLWTNVQIVLPTG